MKPIQNTSDLGLAIHRERKRQKLTQEQLAALSGVGIRFLRELEKGKETCWLGHTLLVMQTLGLSFTILNREDPS